MAALLTFEAVAILLGIPVAQNTGQRVGIVGVVLICALAAAHVGACAVVSRPFAVPVIAALQALLIACWALSTPLGVMGIVFTLVWFAVWYMRREFRRRMATGTLPGPGGAADPGTGVGARPLRGGDARPATDGSTGESR